MNSVESLYFGDVPSKIENAHRLYRELGDRIRGHREIQESLVRLIELEGKLAEAMRGMGLFELCAECGGRPTGGCCSARMANETDSMLLLINLSTGCEVSRRRDDDYECCFLGSGGCSLRFKPFYCLNYLCRQIYDTNDSQELGGVRRATAELLGQLLVVEDLLRQELLG